MSEAMISQYVQINHGSDKPVRFKEDIEVTKTIGNYQFGFDQKGSDIIEPQILLELVKEHKYSLNILKPQEFSVSLRKLLCLTDELF